MKNGLWILLLLSFLHLDLAAQQLSLSGRWYSFARNFNITEVAFNKRKLRLNRYDFTLTNPNKEDSAEIIHSIYSQSRVYHIVKNHRAPDAFFLIGFTTDKERNGYDLLLNSFKKFSNREEINQFIKNDTLVSFPTINFYSDKEFLAMKALKPFSFISKDDFRKYLTLTVESLKKAEAFKKDTAHTEEVELYHQTVVKDNIYAAGYSAIISEEEFELTFTKFRKDPEFQLTIEYIEKWPETPIGLE